MGKGYHFWGHLEIPLTFGGIYIFRGTNRYPENNSKRPRLNAPSFKEKQCTNLWKDNSVQRTVEDIQCVYINK